MISVTRNYFLLFALLSSYTAAFAQSTTERIIYLDSTFNETNQINQKYYRVISDFYKNQLTYKMTDYYKSGKLYAVGYSTDNRYLHENGEFHYYYENGNKKEIIKYEKSVPLGLYFSWYENGNKQIEGEYLKSENDDRSTGSLKINQFWNQQNYQMITGGNGYFDLVTEKGCDEGVIADGLKNGMWYGTDNRFKFNYVEKYNNGKLSVGISSDENLVPHIYRQIEIRPEFPGGIDGFYQYVGRNFRVPEIDNLKGKVFIAFYIEPDGSIDDIKIVKSLHKDVDKEAFRVMSECPNWNAGVLRGIKIKVRYTLPINIQADR